MIDKTERAHHLFLTIDEWASDPFCFCKPVAKTPEDRRALVQAAFGKGAKFFLGSDSAPHPVEAKKGRGKTAAGCFTQPYVAALVVEAMEHGAKNGWIEPDLVTVEVLEEFCSKRGRKFYGMLVGDEEKDRIILEKKGAKIASILKSSDDTIEVVPFRSDQDIRSLQWEAPKR